MEKIISEAKKLALSCIPEKITLSTNDRYVVFAVMITLIGILSVCTFKATIALCSASTFIESCVRCPITFGLWAILATIASIPMVAIHNKTDQLK